MEQIRDIFISYKNDNAGNNFASRLTEDLEEAGYGVYFNSHHQKGGVFPDRLRESIEKCTDFVLIVSQGCLDQLLAHEDVDWIREEIRTAHTNGKNIIPIVLENVSMPYDESAWPEDLAFLANLDYIYFTETYKVSPFAKFETFLHSGREKDDVYRAAFNDNPAYNVQAELQAALAEFNPERPKAEVVYKLGMMYYYGYVSGDGTQSERNYEEAAKYFKLLSEDPEDSLQGMLSNAEFQQYRDSANRYLARFYYGGNLPQEGQSYNKSFEYHKKSETDLDNAMQVAYMMRESLGCSYDFEEIIRYSEEVAAKGDDNAKASYAKYLWRIGRFVDAVRMYESMDHLTAESAYYLGKMYANGVHTFVDSEDPAKRVPPQPDYYRACYYLQEAADQDHIDAAFELALLCFRPLGEYRKNFPKAFRYFKKAADNGNVGAQYMMGYMCENGHVSVQTDEAIHYYEMAAKGNHSQSSLQLATLYQQPECRNYHKAFYHARRAAESGVAEAEYILGNLLLFGRGCEPDENRAYRHFKNAAEKGIFPAKVMKEEMDRRRR